VAGLPLVVPLLVVAAIVIHVARWAPRLELDRVALGRGEPWRLLSAHLTHFGARHLLCDVSAVLALGLLCEARAAARTRWAIAVTAFAVSAFVVWGEPTIERYRGLSGVAVALYTLATGMLIREHRGAVRALLFLAPAAGLVAKLECERRSGAALFAGASGFRPLVSAHVIGAATGVLAACVPPKRSANARSPRGAGRRLDPARTCVLRPRRAKTIVR
jgi:rhomboid family GlyGly-CTERM serine protease